MKDHQTRDTKSSQFIEVEYLTEKQILEEEKKKEK